MTKESLMRELPKKVTRSDTFSGLSLGKAYLQRNGGTRHNASLTLFSRSKITTFSSLRACVPHRAPTVPRHTCPVLLAKKAGSN